MTVRKSIRINADARIIWEIIVSPATWDRWMLVVPELEDGTSLALGKKVLWKNDNGGVYLTGAVSVFDPYQKIVLELEDVSWTRKARPGEVTCSFELSEHNGVTDVMFRLGDLSIDPEAQQWFNAYNESRELEDIKALAER